MGVRDCNFYLFATEQVSYFGCKNVSNGYDSSNPPIHFLELNNVHVTFSYSK